MLSAIVAVSSLLLLSVCFAVTKEKIASAKDEKMSKEKVPMKEALPFLLKSRHFYIIIVLYLVLAITNGTAGIGVYYMRDVLGDANYMGLFSGISAAAMITAMPFSPKLFSVFGKRSTMLFGLGASVIIKLVMMIFASNLIAQLALTFVGTLIIVPVWIGTPIMICDLVDYGDYKRGLRLEGLATSASSFGTKLGAGLGSAILGVGLTIGGYDAMLTAQSAAAKNAVIFIMIGLPGVLCAIGFVLMCFWNLEKYSKEVAVFMASRAAGEGEGA
jgi:GPH family glycoside/pentoside/hexuronide:cation symporter